MLVLGISNTMQHQMAGNDAGRCWLLRTTMRSNVPRFLLCLMTYFVPFNFILGKIKQRHCHEQYSCLYLLFYFCNPCGVFHKALAACNETPNHRNTIFCGIILSSYIKIVTCRPNLKISINNKQFSLQKNIFWRSGNNYFSIHAIHKAKHSHSCVKSTIRDLIRYSIAKVLK